ncbi:MAG: ABC transporter ATP-binding protein [Gemmataceae bacterium]|nr:ABC transporter ATP-binding protein [Gemmataceae bacterium]
MTSPPLPAAPEGEIAIRTADLGKTYGRPAALVHALRGVSLEIRLGERVALLGKSGSGKSTLLNLLGGLDHPTTGRIEIAGRDLARLSGRDLARHRLSTVGMIFQSFNLIPSRTALENVALPLIFAGRSPAERRAVARKALEGVGLGQRLDHRPTELSGGEQQRVAVARALVNEPLILLADEPTGNLDSATAGEVVDLMLGHIRTRGMTLILVTHDEELAGRCTERVLRLHDGQLVS